MTEVKKAKKRKSSTKYPKYTLHESLEIAKAINDNNAGNPFNRLLLAKALKLSPGSSKFRMLITASKKFGLTKGSYAAKEISLAPLGISIIKPKTENEKLKGLKEALFNIEIFQKIFTKFNNNKLPNKELFKNMLERDYGIPQAATEQCYNSIMGNAKELGILQDLSGNLYINLSLLETQKIIENNLAEITGEEITKKEEEVIDETGDQKIKQVISETGLKETIKPKIFIAHSKNKKILEQVKQILEFGQFEPIIAEEEKTASIPIPEKIFGLMKKCDCALINISADEQEKMSDGTYKINQNVLIEIGASFLRYDTKVILLVDKRIKLPSNLQGLSKCIYEGDELSWNTGIELTKILQSFRI